MAHPHGKFETFLEKHRAGGLLLLSSLLFLIGSLRFQQPALETTTQISDRKLPIYCVDTPKKQVALSFDAAWGNKDTQKILDILAKYQLHVTFFMTGGWVKEFPEDVKNIAAAGHDLGNHSETHKNMSQLSKEEKVHELMTVHERVKELTGIDMHLFRPPYGDYDNELILTASEYGYYPIQWSVDSLDWKNYGADDLVQRVLHHKQLQNGAIILCHNGASYTAQALEDLILGLQEKGYEIVPISQLIYKDHYHIDVSGRQIAN